MFAEVTLEYGFHLNRKVKIDVVASGAAKNSNELHFQLNRSHHIEGLRAANLSCKNLPHAVSIIRENLKKLKNSPIFETD